MFMCLNLSGIYARYEFLLRGINPANKKINVYNNNSLIDSLGDNEELNLEINLKRYSTALANVYHLIEEYINDKDIYFLDSKCIFIDLGNYSSNLDESLRISKRIMARLNNLFSYKMNFGLGENIYLAKIACDILANKNESGYAYLNQELFIGKLWYEDLNNFWQFDSSIIEKLNKLKAYNMHDIAFLGRDKLMMEFGLIGSDIYDHAWGDDDIKIINLKKNYLKNANISIKMSSFKEMDNAILELSKYLVSKKMGALEINLIIFYDNGLATSKSLIFREPINSYLFLNYQFKLLANYKEHLSIDRIYIQIPRIKEIIDNDQEIELFENVLSNKLVWNNI